MYEDQIGGLLIVNRSVISTELSIERDEEGNIQMYLQDLITCNKITIIQKINIRHISIRF
jgi:hypothetical protein